MNMNAKAASCKLQTMYVCMVFTQMCYEIRVHVTALEGEIIEQLGTMNDIMSTKITMGLDVVVHCPPPTHVWEGMYTKSIYTMLSAHAHNMLVIIIMHILQIALSHECIPQAMYTSVKYTITV